MKLNLASFAIVFMIKRGKKEEDTIRRISNSKLPAFRARINYMKKNGDYQKVDLFDLAGESKKRLRIWAYGDKQRENRFSFGDRVVTKL
jgi:hypothetical protein